jgi:hypothetical protein
MFFVTVAPNRELELAPCIGTIVSDLEIAWKIAEVKTDARGRPLEPIRIEKVRIFSVGAPPPLPEPVRFVPQMIEPRMVPPPPGS